jgi:hypothetical protein
MRGVDLISDALSFGQLWYEGPNAASNAIGYARQYSGSEGAVIRVYGRRRHRNSRVQGRFQKVVGFLLARTSHRGIEPRCDFLTVIPY